jgi:hypothetical protein
MILSAVRVDLGIQEYSPLPRPLSHRKWERGEKTKVERLSFMSFFLFPFFIGNGREEKRIRFSFPHSPLLWERG